MNKLKNTLLIVLQAITVLMLNAQQERSYNDREITLKNEDSVLVFNILLDEPNIKLKPKSTYYWYKAERIHHNQGGYAGYLLDGKFLLFDNNRHMLEKGTFENGLKTGVWKAWYPSGILKEISKWEDGNKNGDYQLFNQNGELVKTMEYKDNKLHGKVTIHNQEPPTVFRYKDGVKQEPSTSKFKLFLSNLFKRDKKKDKEEDAEPSGPNRVQKEQESVEEEEEKKKGFTPWQKLRGLFQNKKDTSEKEQKE